MDKIVTFLNKVPTWLQVIGFALSVVMIGAAGLLMMTGREGSEKSKKMLVYILIGLAVLFLAADIATSIKSAA